MIFDPAITLMEKALDIASFRHQAVAANIANVNTPGYKRSEVPFATVLAEIMKEFRSGQEETVTRTRQLEEGRLSPLEVSFLQADLAFERNFLGEEALRKAGGPSGSEVSARLRAVQPELEVVNEGVMRYDGNNVNIDMAIAQLARNSTGYGNVTGILSSDFRLLRSVIESR